MNDEHINNLLKWVIENGGKHSVCVKTNKSGVRGLYATKSFDKKNEDEEDNFVIKLPNKLIITPYHISTLFVDKKTKYSDVFKVAPELFDLKYPYKPNPTFKDKLENP